MDGARILSLAGRITLAKSVVTSLPLYVMQSTLVPKLIYKEIDQKVRGFISRSSCEQRKPSLVNWDVVTKPMTLGGLGVRSMKQSNAAVLAKVSWRALNEPSSLWSRVIRGKYCEGRADIDMFSMKPASSPMWKGIVHGAKLLAKGVQISLGNGRSTLFWDHPWVCETPLSDFVVADIPEDSLGLTLQEMWSDQGWNLEAFAHLLPSDIVQKIKCHYLSADVEDTNQIFWRLTSSRHFTSKSAYALANNTKAVVADPFWRLIWRVPVQQRVCQFLYLVAHQALLCNVRRKERHMTSSDACPRCSSPESVLHVLRDCRVIKEAWLSLRGTQLPVNFFSDQDVRHWIQQNIVSDQHWSSLFSFMMWHSWKCRNSLVFSGVEDHKELAAKVCSIFTSYWTSRSLTTASNQPVRAAQQAGERWKKPKAGWWKLNASSLFNRVSNMAGAGGVLRDADGALIKAYTEGGV